VAIAAPRASEIVVGGVLTRIVVKSARAASCQAGRQTRVGNATAVGDALVKVVFARQSNRQRTFGNIRNRRMRLQTNIIVRYVYDRNGMRAVFLPLEQEKISNLKMKVFRSTTKHRFCISICPTRKHELDLCKCTERPS
jgi:hypothetical protein